MTAPGTVDLVRNDFRNTVVHTTEDIRPLTCSDGDDGGDDVDDGAASIHSAYRRRDDGGDDYERLR